MIDGCFLKCHGRVLENLVARDRIVQIDALPLYKKYTDLFDMNDVPEEERNGVAGARGPVARDRLAGAPLDRGALRSGRSRRARIA